jgi:hypothetical protein
MKNVSTTQHSDTDTEQQDHAEELKTAKQEKRELRQREAMRKMYRDRMIACAEEEDTSMNIGDVNAYIDMLMAEGNLEEFGYKTHEEKMKALEEDAKYVNHTIHEAVMNGKKAFAIIDNAAQQKWISAENAKTWKARVKSGDYKTRQEFIDKVLPTYQKNWEALYKDVKKIKKLQRELRVTTKDIPELAAIFGDEFARKKFPEKQKLVDEALAELAVYIRKKAEEKKGQTEISTEKLYKKAKKVLQEAVSEGILAPNKVSHWLRRIFESKAEPAQIQDFLEGKGSMPLADLLQSWRNVRGRFNDIEQRRAAEGTPRSFHFVRAEVFLQWHYDRRKAYVNEADQRFRDVMHERIDFLRIRHEIDAKNWDEADALLTKIDPLSLTIEDSASLDTMRKYVAQNRPESPKKSENPPLNAIIENIDSALGMISTGWVRSMFEQGLKSYGTFWTLAALWQNRKKNREQGQLDAEREEQLHKRAQKQAQATYAPESTGTHTSQILNGAEETDAQKVIHLDSTTADTFVSQVIEPHENNRELFYLTSAIPHGIPYEEHRYIVEHVIPILKQSVRALADRGLTYARAKRSLYQQAVHSSMN